MIKVTIEEDSFLEFLYTNNFQYDNVNKRTCFFDSIKHLSDTYSTYYMLAILDEVLTSFEMKQIIEKGTRNAVLTKLNRSSVDFLEDEIKGVAFDSLQVLGNNDFTFDSIRFSSDNLSSFKKDITNLLYTSVFEYYKRKDNKDTDIKLEVKKDVVYLIIEENGAITLRDKDTTVLLQFNYQQQVDAVAHTIYLNAETSIVYDHYNLMDPEMVVCLKKYLKKKVTFLDEEYPIYSN